MGENNDIIAMDKEQYEREHGLEDAIRHELSEIIKPGYVYALCNHCHELVQVKYFGILECPDCNKIININH